MYQLKVSTDTILLFVFGSCSSKKMKCSFVFVRHYSFNFPTPHFWCIRQLIEIRIVFIDLGDDLFGSICVLWSIYDPLKIYEDTNCVTRMLMSVLRDLTRKNEWDHFSSFLFLKRVVNTTWKRPEMYNTRWLDQEKIQFSWNLVVH